MKEKKLLIIGIFILSLSLISGTALVTALPKSINETKVEHITDTIVKIVSVIEIHEVLGTMYNPVVNQCDADPLITADNSKINLTKLANQKIRWCALSRDLLKRWGGPYDYGDTLTVYHPDSRIKGIWIVHDTMAKRWKKRIDFLVASKNSNIFPHKTHNILIGNTNYYIER